MGITTYWITVATRKRLRGLWITGLLNNKFEKLIEHDWANGVCKENQEFEKKHGKHVFLVQQNEASDNLEKADTVDANASCFALLHARHYS